MAAKKIAVKKGDVSKPVKKRVRKAVVKALTPKSEPMSDNKRKFLGFGNARTEYLGNEKSRYFGNVQKVIGNE